MEGEQKMEKNNEHQKVQLAQLPNIGTVLEKQLYEVGILTYEELKEIGAKQAWLQIQQIDSSACIHRLYALEGAILGVKKSQIPPDVKEDLREFYHWNKK